MAVERELATAIRILAEFVNDASQVWAFDPVRSYYVSNLLQRAADNVADEDVAQRLRSAAQTLRPSEEDLADYNEELEAIVPL